MGEDRGQSPLALLSRSGPPEIGKIFEIPYYRNAIKLEKKAPPEIFQKETPPLAPTQFNI